MALDSTPREVKVVLSDLHLGTGIRPGEFNPYEDFHDDDRLAELVHFYSSGPYRDIPVEIILNGDILDLLKVAYRGRFLTEVTEDVAVEKVRLCLRGHPEVFDALSSFVKVPDHRITYMIGNHDLEVAFPKVQTLIKFRLGLDATSQAITFISGEDLYRLPGGIVVTHGHRFEEMNRTGPSSALRTLPDGREVIVLPWGSSFFANVLAPAKVERPIIDLVQPLSSFILWGLVFDLRFTLKMLWRMFRFFIKTRLRTIYERETDIVKTLKILFEEIAIFNNLDRQATRLLQDSDDIRALIVGHSHKFAFRLYPKGKVYINTGTWLQRVNLDLPDLGTSKVLTYALIEYGPSGAPKVSLMRWRGKMKEYEMLRG